jgi:hypothetical protein
MSSKENTKNLAKQAYNVLLKLVPIQIKYTKHEFDLYNILKVINFQFSNIMLYEKQQKLFRLINQDKYYIQNIKDIVEKKKFESIKELINNNIEVVIEMNKTFIELCTILHNINFFSKEDDQTLIELLNKYKKSTNDILKFSENEEFKIISKLIKDNFELDKSEYNNIMIILINSIPYVYIFESLKILKIIENSQS